MSRERDGGSAGRSATVRSRAVALASDARKPRWELNQKALQTRQQILDEARELFLERGFAGTRIEHIAKACGLTRGALYAYFGSKLDVFVTLGTTTYKKHMALVSRLSRITAPGSRAELRAWARNYFDFMEEHGAFMLAAGHGGPTDAAFREQVRELTLKVAERLGQHLRRLGATSAGSDAALGLVAMAALERSWYFVRGMNLPVSSDEALDTITEVLYLVISPSGTSVS